MSGFRISKLLMIISLTAPLITSPSIAGDIFWLVTTAEAEKVKVSQDQVQQIVSAVAGVGPNIIVRKPTALTKVRAPIDILVTFEPGESGLPPDMTTLKATLIGFIDIDLTTRVKPHLQGSSLDVRDASLPAGSHRIRLAIRDIKGNPNERDLDVNILSGN